MKRARYFDCAGRDAGRAFGCVQSTMYVVLFDIDSTLLRTRGAGRAAFAETFRAEFDIERFHDDISFAGRSDRAIVREVLEQHGIEDRPGTWQRFVQRYLERLERTLAARPGTLLPGVLPLLRAIRERSDIAMGLLTGNVAEGARLKLEHYGIDSFFDFGGYGDRHTDRGGIAVDALCAADAFLRTTHRMSAKPTRTTVIGDTPEDVRCARCIAAKAIAVATGDSSVSELTAAAPDRVFPDLTDRDAILAFITAA